MADFGNIVLPATLTTGIVDTIRKGSVLARLSEEKPMPFTGENIVTIGNAGTAAVVGAGKKKPNTKAEGNVITVKPIKFVYGMRVSDEFIHASEEIKMDYLAAFANAFGKKIAEGFDYAAMTGNDPFTGNSIESLGGTAPTHASVTAIQRPNKVTSESIAQAAADVASNGYVPNGLVVTANIHGDLATEVTATGAMVNPELGWGSAPEYVHGLRYEVSQLKNLNEKRIGTALIGDFSMFRWGYARDMKLDVIEYGDPDGTGNDLRNYNQVYLRGEAYIGWAWLAPAFAGIELQKEAQ